MASRDVVVAHYKEDLEWLHELYNACPAARIFVYTKAPLSHVPDINALPPSVKLIRLPNVGRESHTYLHHIIEHYDESDFAEFIFFTQGHPFDHRNRTLIVSKYLLSNQDFYPPPFRNFLNPKWKINARNMQECGGTVRNSGGTIKDWWTQMFNYRFPNQGVLTVWNGIFTVRKNRILARNKCFYTHLIESLSNHEDPEEGHFFERTWGNIFGLA